jgi:hypothetical protein
METRFDIKHVEPLNSSEVKNVSSGCKFFPSVLFGGRKAVTFVPEFL